MRVAPGAEQSAPQSAPPDAQAPAPSEQGGGGSPAQAVEMIQTGFMALGKFLQSAGDQLPPEDIELFKRAAEAVDALLQSLTGPAQGQEAPQGPPPRPSPGGPMAENASAQSRPSGPQY